MEKQSRVSTRAQKIVAKARLTATNGCCRRSLDALEPESPAPENCFDISPAPPLSSPIPSWWDEVFNAADLQKFNRTDLAKRKLFISPAKGRHCSLSEKSLENIQTDHNNDRKAGLTSLHDESEHKFPKENSLQTFGEIVHINNSVSEGTLVKDHLNPTLSIHSQELYPSHLKIHEAKLALNSGKEHLTRKGKVRQARHVRTPCPDKCKRCQHPRMSQAERLSINEEFWNLKDHSKQWKFIRKSLKISAPKTKVASEGSKGVKLSSRVYFFVINGEARRVCKTMFKSTLSICDSWIDSAISHCSDFSTIEDQRGKHTNRPKRRQRIDDRDEIRS